MPELSRRAAKETSTARVNASEVSQVLQLFARTARTRQLYKQNNAALIRMIDELVKSFERLLERIGDLELKVRPETLLYEELTVLEESNPDESIPFALYRDGVRRLELSRGLSREEIEVLLLALAQGARFSGLGDDIVTFLWQHDLEHVDYLVVDTTIVDAAQTAALEVEGQGPLDIDAQINGLLRSIYGETEDDAGPRSVRVDANDIPAKSIADQLESIDAMAPGFHPPRGFAAPPVYAAALLSSAARESDRAVNLRGLAWSVRALLAELPEAQLASVSESLLRGFDDVLMNNDLKSATYVIQKVREREDLPRVGAWLNEALSDARMRQAAAIWRRAQDQAQSLAFFEAAGSRAVPSLLSQLPLFNDPEGRRMISDLIIKQGLEDLHPLRALLDDEQLYVNVEAQYILARLNTAEARALLKETRTHPQPQLRLGFLEQLSQLDPALQQSALIEALRDEDPRVKVEAATQLRRFANKDTASAIKHVIALLKFQEERYPVKAVFLETYALLDQVWSLRLLTRFVRKADGLLTPKPAEEMGIAAALALRHVPVKRAIDCLQKAAKSRNKQLRSAALRALKEVEA